MNIESLNFSKPVKAEETASRKSPTSSGFTKALAGANASVSKENPTTDNDFKYKSSTGLDGLLGAISKLTEDSKSNGITIADLSSILNSASLQELGNVLGLNLEQQDFSDGLSLDNILALLGIDKEELQKTLQQLTVDDTKVNDVWDMLSGIEQNALSFMQNLLSSIKGDASSKISKDQASQMLQFLKVIELVAPKTDLILKQEYQTFQVKELLSQLSTEVEHVQAQNTKNELPQTKLNNMQPLNIKIVDTTANENVSTLQQSNIKPSTTNVTLTLPTNKTAQAEAFVKEFQAIMNRSQFSNNAAGTKLLIKLYPENLGSIRVELIQKDGVMTARLLASTNIGRQMLESQLQQLKQGLVNQNIQLDRIDVAQALNETNRQEKEQQQFQHAFKQHDTNDRQKQRKDEDEEKANFDDFLTELEV